MASGAESGDILHDRIRLERRLGIGGFSAVWRGTDLETNEAIAVKILHADHEDTPGAVERFRQELQILKRLRHESITPAYLDRTDAPPRFFTLEYVKGETLQARLARFSEDGRHIPLAGVAWLCDRIASALTHAHDHAVVHRDVKPLNVMVNGARQAPFVKVLDFGAAKQLDGATFDPTTIGRVIGSIAYLTPEQLRSRDTVGRTDQFALAVLLYEALTLTRAWATTADGAPLPFHVRIGDHTSQLDLMRRILRGERPRATSVRRELPSSIDEVLMRAMARDPDERFESTEAFRNAFRVALLDAPELTVASSVEDPSTVGGFEDDGPTKLIATNELVDTLSGSLDVPSLESTATRELPALDEPDGEKMRIRAAVTESRDLAETVDEYEDSGLTETMEEALSTAPSKPGN